jgi:UDP-N-acetylmuramyl pentapeptide phosphotransferase/UDP-N-acetylglucosamine-1-phosphate transferase
VNRDVVMILGLATVAFVISAWLSRRLFDSASRFYKLDHPNPRSLHENPTPRGGGLAILAAIVIGGLIAVATLPVSPYVPWISVAAILVAGISFADDWFNLHLGYRIVVHFLAASLLIWVGLDLTGITLPGSVWPVPGMLAAGLSLIFIMWMVNLYNFMDGMDGFAAGMAVIGFGGFAVLGWLSGQPLFGALSLIVAAAAGGFLLSNFPPARIFMGDVGSSVLGFLAAAFMLWADRDGIFPLWIGILVFSPFIVDATVTLIKRILRRERFWEAHKTHYYQRLVQLGWGHRRTVLWEYALMFLCVLSALFVRYLSPSAQWVLISIWLAGYLAIMLAVHQLEARGETLTSR